LYAKTHGKYSEEDLNIELTHVPPNSLSDKSALFAVKCVRMVFDTATMWNLGSITKEKILNRAIFLETIAAIPGMVAAIIRHFRSLRNMARDGGMLNMFLEEANNERMHLLTFIRMKEPGYLFRAAVVGAQFGFGTFFLAAYMISPKWCHRFVGYIEEEACHTYTTILDEMADAPAGSELAAWKDEAAPKIAKAYWHLGERGTVHDVMMAVRADEAEHRDVNHAVSGVPEDTVNPLYDPRVKLDTMLKRYVEDIMDKEATKQASTA
jgi:demethoxyubiquinone hydroxylase (CLK1/Coq7/Cat5 family)